MLNLFLFVLSIIPTMFPLLENIEQFPDTKKADAFTPASVALIIPYIYPDLSTILSFPYYPIKDHFGFSLTDTDYPISAHSQSA